MSFSALFQLYLGGQFYLMEGTGVPGKKTDLSQVTDTLYHIMLYGEDFVMNRVRTPNFSGDRQ
jgi:hypothetical protein